MIATMVLIALDGSGIIHKQLDCNSTVPCPTETDDKRMVQVSKISIFDDIPIIDGKACHITSMYSQ